MEFCVLFGSGKFWNQIWYLKSESLYKPGHVCCHVAVSQHDGNVRTSTADHLEGSTQRDAPSSGLTVVESYYTVVTVIQAAYVAVTVVLWAPRKAFVWAALANKLEDIPCSRCYSSQVCVGGVPRVWIIVQSGSRSPDFLKSRIRILESESYQKRGLRIGRTCFHNLTEYNEIMDRV